MVPFRGNWVVPFLGNQGVQSQEILHLSTSESFFARPLVIGTGAGFGACLMLITGLLVDLNEVAEFRWQVEGADQERKRRESALARLNKPEDGFKNDEHIQGYKRVINGS